MPKKVNFYKLLEIILERIFSQSVYSGAHNLKVLSYEVVAIYL